MSAPVPAGMALARNAEVVMPPPVTGGSASCPLQADRMFPLIASQTALSSPRSQGPLLSSQSAPSEQRGRAGATYAPFVVRDESRQQLRSPPRQGPGLPAERSTSTRIVRVHSPGAPAHRGQPQPATRTFQRELRSQSPPRWQGAAERSPPRQREASPARRERSARDASPTTLAWRYGGLAQAPATMSAERQLVEELAANAPGGQIGPEQFLVAIVHRNQKIFELGRRLAAAEAEAAEAKSSMQRNLEASKAQAQILDATLGSTAAHAENSRKQTLQAWHALGKNSQAMLAMQADLTNSHGQLQALQAELKTKAAELEALQIAMQRSNAQVQALQAELSKKVAEFDAREAEHVSSMNAVQVALHQSNGQVQVLMAELDNKVAELDQRKIEHLRSKDALQLALQRSNGNVFALQAELTNKAAELDARKEEYQRPTSFLQDAQQRSDGQVQAAPTELHGQAVDVEATEAELIECSFLDRAEFEAREAEQIERSNEAVQTSLQSAHAKLQALQQERNQKLSEAVRSALQTRSRVLSGQSEGAELSKPERCQYVQLPITEVCVDARPGFSPQEVIVISKQDYCEMGKEIQQEVCVDAPPSFAPQEVAFAPKMEYCEVKQERGQIVCMDAMPNFAAQEVALAPTKENREVRKERAKAELEIALQDIMNAAD